MKVATLSWPYLLLALSALPFSHGLAASKHANDGSLLSAELLSAELLSAEALASRQAELAAKLARYDMGTKDGPIDSLPVKSPKKITANTAVSEDSVMNDPDRKGSTKGTTSAEGGVTVKDRYRKAMEDETGEARLKKPQSPAHTDESVRKLDSSKVRYSEKSSSGGDGMDDPRDIPHTLNTHADPVKDHAYKKAKHDDSDSEDDLFSSGNAGLIPWDALMGSFSSIAATEIGDKTFIVAALMAMRHPRLQVFTAAFSALILMTILSAITGHAVGSLVSKSWAAVFAALLFLVFGAKMLREGKEMDPNQGVGEEMREVEAELEEKEVDMARSARRRASSISPYALEAGRNSRSDSKPNLKRSDSESPSGIGKAQGASLSGSIAGIKNLLGLVLSPAWVETFSMTFVGELGDRSQIATVAMAAGQEYFWVMVGATLGHFVCTGVAVLGGSVLAGRITMRKVTLIGGAIFIGFGLFTLFEAVHLFT